ncbi:MAG: pyridoxamine 5'-phosphate oxidase family protein [Acidimicrobiia bacterium]
MATITTPSEELDPRYSDPEATPTPWLDAAARLRDAELYWITTVRAGGAPHATPLIGLWVDGAVWFCTGTGEQKARNLGGDDRCTLATATDRLHGGLDVVVEGRAGVVRDEGRLARIADAYVAKYGDEWRFEVAGGGFRHPDQGGSVDVFELSPARAFAFARQPYGQTRYRF